MSKQHLEMAVSYATAHSAVELAISVGLSITSLKDDVDNLRETMVASGSGVVSDLGELASIIEALKGFAKTIERCEKAGRKRAREMREAISNAS